MEVVVILEVTVASVRVLMQLLALIKQFVDENPQIKVYVRRIIQSVKQQLHWNHRNLYLPSNVQQFKYETQYVDFLPHMTVVPHRKSGHALRRRFLDGRYLMDASRSLVGWKSDDDAETDDQEYCVVDMPVYDWKLTPHSDPILVLHRTDLSGEIIMPQFQ